MSPVFVVDAGIVRIGHLWSLTIRDIDLAFRDMVALVRSAALTHFTEGAVACGLDARALVAEVGLPPRCLVDPDLRVPAQRVGRLLEMAQRGTSRFGPAGRIALACRTWALCCWCATSRRGAALSAMRHPRAQ